MGSHALILAGGGGTRLWPASRKRRPKQFLPLLEGNQSLLGATVARLQPLFASDALYVVTAADQVAEVARAAPSLPVGNLVIEPKARNTAPCIGLGAIEVLRRDPEALVAVIPSDQYVAAPEAFVETVRRAMAVAATGAIVTIGIVPTRPETGFGYIERSDEQPDANGAHAVQRFVEKPDAKTAAEYVGTGRFLWNSGMFFFRAARLVEAIRRHMPALASVLDEIAREPERAAEIYPTAPAISIDYGVMEKLGPGEVRVVPGDFGWSDVGAWNAVAEVRPHDEQDNTRCGETVVLDAARNVVYAGPGRVVAVVGVSDLCVVADEDGVLVMPRQRAQEVRDVVRALETTQRSSYL